jgi:hypothetical protein
MRPCAATMLLLKYEQRVAAVDSTPTEFYLSIIAVNCTPIHSPFFVRCRNHACHLSSTLVSLSEGQNDSRVVVKQ